jgi:hypothetical protein
MILAVSFGRETFRRDTLPHQISHDGFGAIAGSNSRLLLK